MRRKQRNNRIFTGLALAALGLSSHAARAQFPTINNPIAPRIFPLGGPITQFNLATPSFANQFGMSAAFNNRSGNSPFGGFAPVVVGNQSNFNNVPRNIVFGGDGRFAPLGQEQVVGANQLINDPLSGFRQPRVLIDQNNGLLTPFGIAGTSSLPVDTTMFFQNNPAISPFQVNGSLGGNFGINTFNTNSVGFNQLNSGFVNTGFNNGFNMNGMVTSSALLNNSANMQVQRIFRPKQPFNPTGPNLSNATATASNVQTIQLPFPSNFVANPRETGVRQLFPTTSASNGQVVQLPLPSNFPMNPRETGVRQLFTTGSGSAGQVVQMPFPSNFPFNPRDPGVRQLFGSGGQLTPIVRSNFPNGGNIANPGVRQPWPGPTTIPRGFLGNGSAAWPGPTTTPRWFLGSGSAGTMGAGSTAFTAGAGATVMGGRAR